MPRTSHPLLASLLVLSLLVLSLVAPATVAAQTQAAAPETLAIIDSLVREFDHAWEPQRGTPAENLARLDRLFVTDSSFLWLADGRPQADRARWLQGNRFSLGVRAARTDSIRHRTLWSTVVVLDSRTIVHNSVYCADSWRKDGTTGTAEGATTFVFVRQGNTWRIATYHGSTFGRTQPIERCPASIPGGTTVPRVIDASARRG
jgi:hypothetical protein